MLAIPKSLQSLIREARRIKSAQSENSPNDPGELGTVDDFLEGLCREEYSRELYLICLADDCEELGDWEGAEDAYREIIGLDESSSYDRFRAYSRIGSLSSLVGRSEAALENFQFATAEARSDESKALVSLALSQEAWQLMSLGEYSQAEKLASKGLEFSEEVEDILGKVKLLTVLAVCELAKSRMQRFQERSEEAWQELEALRAICEEHGVFQDAAGIHTAFCTWWRVQAEYQRVNGNREDEISALTNSLDKARYVASQSQVEGPRADAIVARTLLSLAASLRLAERSEEAITHTQEADEIALRRKLPGVTALSNLV